MSDGVLISIITGGFGVIGSGLALLARANKREHGENSGKLDRLLETTEGLKHGHDRIERKVDTHINDHARGDV